MKVIDLLNKIANGEVPKKIKYDNNIYEYNKDYQDYGYFNTGIDRYITLIENELNSVFNLTEEVEIIEDTSKEDTTINIQDLFNERVEQNKRIEELVNINEKLSLALESAEQRIDKAIEYIETKISDKKGVVVLPDLLDILRGDDNEFEKGN